MAMAIYAGGGLVFDPEHPTGSRRFLPHSDARAIAVSPDGRWVVTGSHTRRYDEALGCGSRADSSTTFQRSRARAARALFSPDGRWLAVGSVSRGWELIDTATWASRDSASGHA